MKVMHSVLSGGRIAPPVIDARPEVALHYLADLNVLVLDLVTEFNEP
jgi:hypothetical protein